MPGDPAFSARLAERRMPHAEARFFRTVFTGLTGFARCTTNNTGSIPKGRTRGNTSRADALKTSAIHRSKSASQSFCSNLRSPTFMGYNSRHEKHPPCRPAVCTGYDFNQCGFSSTHGCHHANLKIIALRILKSCFYFPPKGSVACIIDTLLADVYKSPPHAP